jgi:hypothetical protein
MCTGVAAGEAIGQTRPAMSLTDVEMERERQPNASLRSLMEAAIELWGRNNR